MVVCMLCLAGPVRAAVPDTDAILESGKFDEGIVALEAHLKQQPQDDNARFGLAVVQFVQSAQGMARKLVAYGPITYGDEELQRLFGGTPAPKEDLTYPRLREIIQEWLQDLTRIEATLAKIKPDEVRLPLHVARIPLNFSRNGAQSLTLVPFLGRMGQARPEDVVIAFDRADVDWMRGYCHLLSALCEIGLAYDGQELFDVVAHRSFKHVKTPHKFLLDEPRPREGGSWFNFEEIADVIAAIHVLRFPVKEPQRMEIALKHIEQTMVLSRSMWKRVLAETDDDREWIPSPMQTNAVGARVTQEMVDHWIIALDEAEAIVQGKKLLPFWRGKKTYGVNLRKAFLKPGPFDVVLWVQGAAATPYLEEGEITSPDTWRQINQVFRGQFVAFGFWFN